MYFYGYRQHQPHAFVNKLNKLNKLNYKTTIVLCHINKYSSFRNWWSLRATDIHVILRSP